ncbi:uncharacterized protein LOC120458837 [Drosophila santomea]|uniref:uncharacterized protein LOC120458837 n=1 Tax=Drosophila santomea TaxID=129105 RepID=UPI001CCAE150|nr:uncharacterized protein LOC120458837 [Drosophila santomea]
MQNVYQTKHGKAASRRIILAWINSLLGTSFTCLEDLRTGVEYCQMLHKLQPSAIRLNKVFKKPRTHYEFVHNMRLLQKSLFKQGVEKQIPIQRLVSGGNSENLEFARWFKAFYDLNYQLLRGEITQDAQDSEINVMKTSVEPQSMPECFGDTEKNRNGSRCRNYLHSINPRLVSSASSPPSKEPVKNFENYQRCECGSYKYSTTPRSNSVFKSNDHQRESFLLRFRRRDLLGSMNSTANLKWSHLRNRHYFRMAHSFYDMLEAVNRRTAHINSTLNTISRNLIRENAEVSSKVFHKKYRILYSRFIKNPNNLKSKRDLQNTQENSQPVRLLNSENQKQKTLPSIDKPDIVLATQGLPSDVEDPSKSWNSKIDVADGKPGNEPDLLRSPESITTQIIEDSGTVLITQSLPLDDDVLMSSNLETLSAKEKDLGEQSTLKHDIYKAEMDKQTIAADDLSSDFEKFSDEEELSLGPELYYSSSADEWSLNSQEGCTTDRCFSPRKLSSPTNNSLNYSEDLFQAVLKPDNPISFGLQITNICNSANIRMTDELLQNTEIDLEKIDPKNWSLCKNSNGKLLGKRLAQVFYRSRQFKLRSTFGGLHKQKTVKIESLKYSIRNLKTASPSISSEEEYSSDESDSAVGDIEQKLTCVLEDLQRNLKNLRKILKNPQKINERRKSL